MKIIAGNFKSNKTHSATIAYLKALDLRLDSIKIAESKGAESAKNAESKSADSIKIADSKITESTDIYIFPSICAMCENRFKNFTLGAQNAHFAESGAFTGEATLSHLRNFDIQTILLGHSERRNLFGESDEIIKKKFDFFASNNLQIFLCVGENLAVRKSGKTKEFLHTQLAKINLDYDNLIIAYEPIWAIGTGENASLAQISEVYEFLSNLTQKAIIYGGSVNERNAGEILRVCDGVLVGNASLEVEIFYQIINGGK